MSFLPFSRLSCKKFPIHFYLAGEADCQGCGRLAPWLLPPHAQPLPHAPHPHPRHQRQVRPHRGPRGHRCHPHLQHPLPEVVELCSGCQGLQIQQDITIQPGEPLVSV